MALPRPSSTTSAQGGCQRTAASTASPLLCPAAAMMETELGLPTPSSEDREGLWWMTFPLMSKKSPSASPTAPALVSCLRMASERLRRCAMSSARPTPKRMMSALRIRASVARTPGSLAALARVSWSMPSGRCIKRQSPPMREANSPATASACICARRPKPPRAGTTITGPGPGVMVWATSFMVLPPDTAIIMFSRSTSCTKRPVARPRSTSTMRSMSASPGTTERFWMFSLVFSWVSRSNSPEILRHKARTSGRIFIPSSDNCIPLVFSAIRPSSFKDSAAARTSRSDSCMEAARVRRPTGPMAWMRSSSRARR